MRVLYFSDNCSGHNRRFLEKLSSSGHEVWFLDSSTNQLPNDWLPAGVRWWRPNVTFPSSLTPREYRAFLPEFQRCVSEVQPDLVHAGPLQKCAYVAALAGFHPLVVTSWGSDILLCATRNSEWKEATSLALRGGDAFFCDCNSVRNAALDFVSLPDSRIVQFPWGIKQGLFSPDDSISAGAKMIGEPGTIPIISTRCWEPLYGITVLLEAFHAAYSKDSRLRLFLLNHGSQSGYLKDYILRCKLDKVVLTPGVIAADELPQWYRAAKGYMSCTASDGSSISLLEAMATGLPVLVSDISSNREWVTEPENGWLAPPNSAEVFSSKLLQLAGLGETQYKAISARNQKIVSERADWDKNFPRLTAMYQHLVSSVRQYEDLG